MAIKININYKEWSVMIRTRVLFATFCTSLTQYINPYAIKVSPMPEPPKIKLRN